VPRQNSAPQKLHFSKKLLAFAAHCANTALQAIVLAHGVQQMLTVASVTHDDDITTTVYNCDFVAACDGTSIWDNTANKQVHVTAITVHEHGDDYTLVNVTHDSVWTIYTDGGFARAISAALGYDVNFTEQGMQEDNMASMEVC